MSRQTEEPDAPDRLAADRGVPGRGPRPLDPRMAVVWTVQAAAGATLVTFAVLSVEVVVRLAFDASGERLSWPTGLGAVAVAALGALAAWRLPRAYHRAWSFELAPDALELRHGIVLRVHSAIPYHRVQYIDIRQGPVERALRLSRLVVHTAAATSDASIPGIASDEAQSLRRTLLERAGVGDAV